MTKTVGVSEDTCFVFFWEKRPCLGKNKLFEETDFPEPGFGSEFS